MKKNHISARMKRILAIACAAALVCTSVPAGTYAYADEVADTEERVKADPKTEEKAEDGAEKALQEETAPASKDEEPEEAAPAAVEDQAEEAAPAAGEEKPEEDAPAAGEEKSEEDAPAAGEKKPEEDAPVAPAEDEAKQNVPAGEEAKEDPPAKEGQPAPASGGENEEAKPADGKSGGASDTEKPQDEEKEPEDKDSPKAADRAAKKAAEQKKTSKEAKNAGPEEDITSPSITIKVKGEQVSEPNKHFYFNTRPITVEFVATEEPDGNWSYSYKKGDQTVTGEGEGLSFSISLNDEAVYSDFKVEGMDAAGNEAEMDPDTEGLQVVIDRTSPKVSAVADSDNEISITIDESNPCDEGKAYFTLSFTKDGNENAGLFHTNNPAIVFEEEGVYEGFTIAGRDAAGNELAVPEELRERLSKIKIVVDQTAPGITLTSVVADEDGNDQHNETLVLGKEKVIYTFGVTDNIDNADDVVTKYIVSSSEINISNPGSVDTSSWTDVSGETSFTVVAEAKAYVYIWAKDTKGNAAAKDFKALVVEGNPPSLEVTKLNSDVQIWNNLIHIKTNDRVNNNYSGIQKVTYELKRGENVVSSNSVNKPRPNSIPSTWDIQSVNFQVDFSKASGSNKPNGLNTLTVTAYDWCGNASEAKSVDVYFDTTAPEVGIVPEEGKFAEDAGGVKVTKDGKITIKPSDTVQDGDPKHTVTGKVYPESVKFICDNQAQIL